MCWASILKGVIVVLSLLLFFLPCAYIFAGVMLTRCYYTHLGGFIIFVGVLGMALCIIMCVISYNMSKIFFYVFLGLTLSIVVMELIILLIAVTRSPESTIQAKFDDYWADLKNAQKQKTIDDIQREMQCCGAKRITDWTDKDLPVPQSCHYTTRGCAQEINECSLLPLVLAACLGAIMMLSQGLIGVLVTCLYKKHVRMVDNEDV